MKTDDGSLEKK